MKLVLVLIVLISLGCEKKNGNLPPDTTMTVHSLAHSCQAIMTYKGPLTYCYENSGTAISTTPKTRIVYLFHGIFGDPESYFQGESSQMIEEMHTKFGEQSPLFISLSLGPAGVITDNVTDIVDRVIPQIESHFNLGTKIRRDLIGQSMGAHNLLRIAAALPNEFHSAAILCPALISFDPFDPSQLQAYFQRNAPYLDQKFALTVFQAFRSNFANEQQWTSNNPFVFLQNGAYDNLDLFVSVGMQDSLGFNEGAKGFTDDARKRNIDVTWAPVNGPHCSFDRSALVNFESR